MRGWRNVPCCERCWIEQEGEWDMETRGDEVWQRLVSLRMPVRLVTPELETCYSCGWPTISGIYVRREVEVEEVDG